MNESNKLRSVTWIAVSLIVIALWFTVVFSTCGCTPIKNERISTKEYKEAKIISATIVFIDSEVRNDHWVSVLYWEDAENIKWFTYSVYPTPYWIGYRMPLLTKR